MPSPVASNVTTCVSTRDLLFGLQGAGTMPRQGEEGSGQLDELWRER